jgi:hypothetical protein
MARQAGADALGQADLLGEVITAVFDRLDLSAAARTSANELLKAELLEAADRWEARQTRMSAAAQPRSLTSTGSDTWSAR